MFSGKSEELIRRLRRAQIARQKVQIFKPAIDDRYGDDHITSHSEMKIASESLQKFAELLTRAAETEVVGIDEGQFFDQELPAVCSTLADQGKRVIVAGLDQDYLGKPFELMPQLRRSRSISRRPSPSASSAARPPITRSGSSRAGSACSSAAGRT